MNVPHHVRAQHEAGHVVVALAYGIRVYGASIEQMSSERFGQTVTGRPPAESESLARACDGLTQAERLRTCRVYARVALGGTAGEIVAQRILGRAVVAPTPCTCLLYTSPSPRDS